MREGGGEKSWLWTDWKDDSGKEKVWGEENWKELGSKYLQAFVFIDCPHIWTNQPS